ADRRGDGDGSDNREHRDAIDQVSRHDQLAQLAWRRSDEKCIALTLHKSSEALRCCQVLAHDFGCERFVTPWSPQRTALKPHLDRKPRSATMLILDSPGGEVNPVIGLKKDSPCKAVPCPEGQAGGWGSARCTTL